MEEVAIEIQSRSGDKFIKIRPTSGMLDPDTYYMMVVTTALQNAAGTAVESMTAECSPWWSLHRGRGAINSDASITTAFQGWNWCEATPFLASAILRKRKTGSASRCGVDFQNHGNQRDHVEKPRSGDDLGTDLIPLSSATRRYST